MDICIVNEEQLLFQNSGATQFDSQPLVLPIVSSKPFLSLMIVIFSENHDHVIYKQDASDLQAASHLFQYLCCPLERVFLNQFNLANQAKAAKSKILALSSLE
ncbi:MAG: hypothetical protein EZS28_056080 [Streblomastix strix]|uniref:Uncharacterized protein n=1 Tax=Streblomastix strix TaxID=222440 RepID=A0A5J4PPX6_9EUKA|nr:MAG: hypothetical protein EZS28_056080 [Streblomastix strix]